MAASKRPTLAEAGIDKLFHPSNPPTAERPAAAPATSAASPETWEATHRRRTFHCPNVLWDQLVHYCDTHNISRSAAITEALEAFLRQG